jgi:hypothetical protein
MLSTYMHLRCTYVSLLNYYAIKAKGCGGRESCILNLLHMGEWWATRLGCLPARRMPTSSNHLWTSESICTLLRLLKFLPQPEEPYRLPSTVVRTITSLRYSKPAFVNYTTLPCYWNYFWRFKIHKCYIAPVNRHNCYRNMHSFNTQPKGLLKGKKKIVIIQNNYFI